MDIYAKLDPQRFPNMSLPMVAILGLIVESTKSECGGIHRRALEPCCWCRRFV